MDLENPLLIAISITKQNGTSGELGSADDFNLVPKFKIFIDGGTEETREKEYVAFMGIWTSLSTQLSTQSLSHLCIEGSTWDGGSSE